MSEESSFGNSSEVFRSLSSIKMAAFTVCRRACFPRYYSIRSLSLQTRGLCSVPEHVIENGLVLGGYESDNQSESGFTLTSTASSFNSRTSGRLKEILKISGFKGKLGKTKTLYGLDRDYPCIITVGLGKENPESDIETGEERMEAANIRHAAAAGAKALREAGVKQGEIEPFTNSSAAAEGALLSLFSFDKLKAPKKHKLPVDLKLYKQEKNLDSSLRLESWERGKILAASQNFARELMETPANLMTPKIFTETVKDRLGHLDSIDIQVRGQSWAEEMKMGAFLSVGKASSEESLFMEITYSGATDNMENPFVLVGKGVTFDSGGISIKPAKSMGQMKADMGGAATVCAALEAIALLKLPINVTVLTPLCENMVSGNALKPGDVITASNGKTIEVENTDAEGRLILADALCYANSLSPSVIVDVATLTGAMDICLGQGAVGVFTNSLTLCHQLNQAGFDTGERMWRLPLYKHYREQIDSDIADLLNTGKTRSAGSSTAAMFLKEFVDCKHWAHLDIAGVMHHTDAVPYLGKGMSGRPTRALVELANRLSQYKLD